MISSLTLDTYGNVIGVIIFAVWLLATAIAGIMATLETPSS